MTDRRGVYLKDDKGNRILACPVLTAFRIENAQCNVAFSLKSAHEMGGLNEKRCKTREQEAWPVLSGNVQPRSEARELARKQRIKEEKHRRQVAWKEQQNKKENLTKSKEEAHVAAMTEKYGKFWHREVAYSSDDCDTALNIRIMEECDWYYEEERAFTQMNIYTDEHLKWDKPPVAVCLLIDLSVTLPLNI